MKRTNATIFVAGFFYVLSAVFLTLLILSISEIYPNIVGSFFYGAFHLASLYLPAYLAVLGSLVYFEKASAENLTVLNATFFPFLTLALCLKIAFAPQLSGIERIINSLFLNPGAAVVLLGLFALEMALIAKLWSQVKANAAAIPNSAQSSRQPIPNAPQSADSFVYNFNDVVLPDLQEEPQLDLPAETVAQETKDSVTQEPFAFEDTGFSFNDETVSIHEGQNTAPPSPQSSPALTALNELQDKLKVKEDDLKRQEAALQMEKERKKQLTAVTDDFSFLDDSLPAVLETENQEELLRLDGEQEFQAELEQEKERPKPVTKPSIDIEHEYEKRKEELSADPAMNFLSSQNIAEEAQDTAEPFGGRLFTSEESAALEAAAEEIAQNAKEENQIEDLIKEANSELDKALNQANPLNSLDLEPSAYSQGPQGSEKKNEALEDSSFLNSKLLEADLAEKNPFVEKMAQLKNEIPQDFSHLPLAAGTVALNSIESSVIDYSDSAAVFEEDADEDDLSLNEPDTFSVEAEFLKDEQQQNRQPSYSIPIDGLLESYEQDAYWEIDDATEQAAYALESTLKEFNIEAKVIAIRKGPVITMFELLPAPGVKLSKIESLSDNIAFRLAAKRVRIVAPIPGKQAVGVEAPNKHRAIVSFAQLLESPQMHDKAEHIPLILGKDIAGENQVIDLAKTPHLLIAGSTGSGKSVCVNSIICSILYTRSPNQTRMILIDPKVVELKPYNDIPHLLAPVITEPKRALQAVQWAMYEMERRYSLLDSMGVRNIRSYNKKVKERAIAAETLPYIVVVIDEFADLMAASGKELEQNLARLAAKSRAAGIHLVLATQRPSVDVITGLIKANFPSRIAFMVASKMDSRIILDMGGAEQLLGKGDMLFTSSWNPFPTRIQGAFLSEEEVERIAAYVKTLGKPDYIDDEMFYDEDDLDTEALEAEAGDDPLFEKALEIVFESKKASASYLQRRLKIGYNRAARLVELMEERGIVGPPNGSKAREILKAV